uniref:Uncharacterized protein n=1 Tax=Physcomitrium patens TaxID=3218 RepID=A0A2K1IP66_PHYPA|nr:hypothetical protein PHYPA_027388 [Physcomitrium patens]
MRKEVVWIGTQGEYLKRSLISRLCIFVTKIKMISSIIILLIPFLIDEV